MCGFVTEQNLQWAGAQVFKSQTKMAKIAAMNPMKLPVRLTGLISLCLALDRNNLQKARKTLADHATAMDRQVYEHRQKSGMHHKKRGSKRPSVPRRVSANERICGSEDVMRSFRFIEACPQ
jgi:hypothetical protein